MHLAIEPGTDLGAHIRERYEQIILENTRLVDQINFDEFAPFVNEISQAKAIFLVAAGRSGYAMRSIAMRLMHLGLKVHFVGDTTTPAIQPGDLLWASSGSGSTESILKAAEKAKAVGARIIAITTNAASTLAQLADAHLQLPAAEKQDHQGSRSKQYAGSLFEQSILLTGDALFMELWKLEGSTAETLWKRHANLE
ncbi:6-phospho-3-hexuloisomerase [Siphonobacter sp. SORGH_AS_1065]|uniref:6-phospho-3-hexuloisomerase n=1 Tax=Siphonobacter sp. SORGH_AS_1065 TaxID=3041795 RepID=UPI0027831865|nr:6-phospho-3-hexuloisomerase [Siphonobacter sp. SORGH_AS_1065]MDQ1085491.1 6-phospho-3-hexuloisomerase [Siphonobacter sp. SORGH_AS_1065]